MADLDDFFAKKDRKKKTSKKFTTTEEVAKKLEDTAKKTEKLKKDRLPEGEESNVQLHEQDEWKEFEEEKKDYTGLKIGNLTINPEKVNSSHNQDTESGEQMDGSETTTEPEKKSGPWKRLSVQPEPIQQEEIVVEAPNIPTPIEPKTYRPPSLRNQSGQSSSNQAPSRGRGPNKAGAPDIHNEEFFPTLNKSGDKKGKGEGAFEVVQQHKSSSAYYQHVEQTKSGNGPQLNLGNRYNTLSNDS
ncbi:hypothetical protein ABEB36_006959 [Hypothenemus hampei]|uniref:Protein CDV3 homolog n=1 Tax=Hypothenemus hampei TaxID=57062 RepID=A0ABD1ESC0_HYPHA